MNSYKELFEIHEFDIKKEGIGGSSFFLPGELIEAIDFTSLGVVRESSCLPTYIEGENYAIMNKVGGITIENKIYKLIKVVDEFNGSKIDSLIVKQISGPVSKIYALSPHDCECHKIPFQEGLQLFPKGLPWYRVKERVRFNPYDMSTTPLSDVDNTIRHILLKLNGFGDYYDNYIITPSGRLLDEEEFKNTLTIYSRDSLPYGNGFVWKANKNFNASIVYPNTFLFNHGNFISSNGEIFLRIDLLVRGLDNTTIDGFFGVEPIYLKNINPSKFFKIVWDERSSKKIK